MTDPRASEPATGPSTGGSRPRPLYGEYATPEEQRARIAQPQTTYALETGRAPASAVPSAPLPAPLPAAPVGERSPSGRRIDLIVTLAMLGYGLVNVVLTVVQLMDFPSFAQQFMSVAGIDGEFTNVVQGQLWATVGAVLYAGVFLAGAFVVYLLHARGRRTWWVPLVAAVLAFVLLTVCLTAALMGDPAVMGSLTRTP